MVVGMGVLMLRVVVECHSEMGIERQCCEAALSRCTTTTTIGVFSAGTSAHQRTVVTSRGGWDR